MRRWQLQEAKSRLSELVKRAGAEGPQEITVHGKAAVVVLSRADFEKLTDEKKPNLVEFMQSSPLMGLDIDFERDADDTARQVDLD